MLIREKEKYTLHTSKYEPLYSCINSCHSHQYNDIEHLLTADMTLIIGRTSDCGIQVKSNSVSRSHVMITFDKGKILLKDHSTNGTYVRTHTGSGADQDIYIHREEWPMIGNGTLSLGAPTGENNPYLVYFECRS